MSLEIFIYVDKQNEKEASNMHVRTLLICHFCEQLCSELDNVFYTLEEYFLNFVFWSQYKGYKHNRLLS